jgi:hypothetical protein
VTYEQLVGVVRDLGFPIFVAGYLLLRMDRLLVGLTKQVQHLASAIETLAGLSR